MYLKYKHIFEFVITYNSTLKMKYLYYFLFTKYNIDFFSDEYEKSKSQKKIDDYI